MGYSCLLVDDEAEVIRAIRKKLDWAGLGYDVPHCATNGLEALELAEEVPPDVVLTDIKMPYMDGLELSRRLKELYPNVRIIIFSGFDEFEYAREAIRLEVEEYILKPVHSEELEKIFLRIREQLDREADERRNLRMLKDYYNKSLPMLQENFYAALMDGKLSDAELNRQMEDYQIDLHGPLFTTVVFHLSKAELSEGMTSVLLSVSVRKLAEERIEKSWGGRFFHYLGNTVMIAQLAEEGDLIRLTDACDQFCRLAKAVLKAPVTAGIGISCSRVKDLPSSYSGARGAVSYRIIYGNSKAINIAEIAPQERSVAELESSESLRDIFRMIRMDRRQELPGAIAAYIEEKTASRGTIQEYRFFVMGLAGELYRFSRDNELSTEEIFGDNDGMYRTIQQLEPEELTRWMTEVCMKMQEMVRNQRSDTTRSFVGRAIEYVEDNYGSSELSIDSVCSHLGVSAAYFSTVFKRETGKTFINYLTDFRMKRAAELLLNGNEKTYVIARKVGYADPNYFSYVFKKQHGMSPSRYKGAKDGQ